MIGNKYTTIALGLILCAIGFFIPIWFKDSHDSFSTTISLSLSVLGNVATVFTLILAILLVDRFSLKGRFLESQTNKVFELIDELKGKKIDLYHPKWRIFLRHSGQELKSFQGLSAFKDIQKNKIVFSYEDFEKFS